jgi:ketosteroid isomerase-like protein
MTDHSALKATIGEVLAKLAQSAETLDVKEFASLLHDDYMSVDFDGKTHTKHDRVEEWRKEDFKPSSVTVRDLHVRPFGDTVISTGISSVKGMYHGHDISGDYRFTQVFVHKQGTKLTAAAKPHDLLMTHSTAAKL